MVDFLTRNTALDRLNEQTGLYRVRAAEDRQQRLEDEQLQREQAVDAAVRQGLQSIYAGDGPAGPAQPAATPAPAGGGAPTSMTPPSVANYDFGPDSPIGLRNNNPGNLVRTDTAWQGMSANQAHPTFVTFDTPEAGIRAAAMNLQTYGERGINTLTRIFETWAPAGHGDNDPAAYAARVGQMLGVDPNVPLDLTDPSVLYPLLQGIITVENGSQPYTEATLRSGLSWAGLALPGGSMSVPTGPGAPIPIGPHAPAPPAPSGLAGIRAGGMDPLMAQLTGTPGAGNLAWDYHQQLTGADTAASNRAQDRAWDLADDARDREERMEELALQALANGDMHGFQYWAGQTGLSLPPEMIADAQSAALLARGMLLARDMYEHDPAQAQAFVQGYVGAGGGQAGVDAGIQAAGTPQQTPLYGTGSQANTLRDARLLYSTFYSENMDALQESLDWRGRSAEEIQAEAIRLASAAMDDAMPGWRELLSGTPAPAAPAGPPTDTAAPAAPSAPPAGNVPPAPAQTAPAAPAAPQQTAPAAPSAGGGDPLVGIPASAIQALQANPSPENQRLFNEAYAVDAWAGQDLASIVLGAP